MNHTVVLQFRKLYHFTVKQFSVNFNTVLRLKKKHKVLHSTAMW